MCGNDKPRGDSPKEMRFQNLERSVARECLTTKDLKALCEPGVLSDVVARLHEASAHKSSVVQEWQNEPSGGAWVEGTCGANGTRRWVAN